MSPQDKIRRKDGSGQTPDEEFIAGPKLVEQKTQDVQPPINPRIGRPFLALAGFNLFHSAKIIDEIAVIEFPRPTDKLLIKGGKVSEEL